VRSLAAPTDTRSERNQRAADESSTAGPMRPA
jgi:hypothetical protein